MTLSFLDLINFLYPCTATIMLLFYLPQIWTVIRAKSALNEISLSSWGVWSFCSMVTAAYAYLIALDNKIAFFATVNSSLCFVVFGVTLWKRFYKYKLNTTGP